MILAGVDIEAAIRSMIKVARIPGSKIENSPIVPWAKLSIYLIWAILRKRACLSLYLFYYFVMIKYFFLFEKKRS
jgi:hypothetical protein